jgi:hypothetical protein
MTGPAVTIRSDFLDVNVQAYIFNQAWEVTRWLPVSAKRWDKGTRLLLVYSVLSSLYRLSARKQERGTIDPMLSQKPHTL